MNKLNESDNYQLWAHSVTLWLTSNGCEDHLTSTETSVAEDKRPKWQKLDALLCNIL